MKAFTLVRLGLALFLSSLAPLATAQKAAPAPQGYWTVETNLTTRDYTLVRFYNAQDQLVYTERLDHFNLDLARKCPASRRASRRLTLVLQQVLRNPAASQVPTLVAQQFDLNRWVRPGYAAR
ncbi:hypothetical protein [Hymenobacter jejuensis]|uniref:Uncharacterized protein n=1 Tax=Hymenobacter jejuensis TaxID=2502781 RepID=A0A5B8A520_9BACT|nr:hypothetical protein [Hymenobacter jejuensis]QDA61292.1 hypothetical protein FHG12_14855 [Hymenobacter jejuensis]